MKDRFVIDDESISKPPYDGPKKSEIKTLQLSEGELDKVLEELFAKTIYDLEEARD